MHCSSKAARAVATVWRPQSILLRDLLRQAEFAARIS